MSAADALVTAIMPLKRYHWPHLQAAIGSLIEQTSRDWNLVIVVEPEALGSFRALLAEPLRDPRVRVIPNEHVRYAGAFNTGMERADTSFVGILLGDDMWDPHAVEVLSEQIRAHPEVDLFHTGRRVVDSDGRPLSGEYAPVDDVTPDMFASRSPVKHLICWRREMGIAIGGMDERIVTAGPDDFDFPWLMADRGAVIRAVHRALYVYRDHLDGFRNTTHIPRSVHVRNLKYIYGKHGLPSAIARRNLRRAKRGYLRQCLYRNRLHQWIWQRLGWVPRQRWRETYR
jgi:GT2 family glycosyltransferase